MKRPYDHEPSMCDSTCDIDTCRRAYRRALGLEARERRWREDARRADEDAAWMAGRGWGLP